jgi:signal transduction histidine kinase
MTASAEPVVDLGAVYDQDARRMLRFGAPLVALVLLAEGISHLKDNDPALVVAPILGALPVAVLGWRTVRPPARAPIRERHWPVALWLVSALVLLLHMQHATVWGTTFFILAMLFASAAFIVPRLDFALTAGPLWLLLLWWHSAAMPEEPVTFVVFTLPLVLGVHLARHRALLLGEQQRILEQQLLNRREESELYHRLRAIAAGMSDHFSTVLEGVLAGTGEALEQLDGDHPARPAVERARESGRAGARLLERLGTDPIVALAARRRIRPETLVDEATCNRLLAAPARFETRVEPGLPAIEGDPDRLRDAVTELVRNAAEALPEEGGLVCVDITAGRNGEQVLIDVIDTGSGIEDARRRRVLEPFYSDRAPGRRGLGLSFVLGVVGQHGGTLQLESQPGLGSRFRLELPATPEES